MAKGRHTGGKPEHVPTTRERNMVQLMAAGGIAQALIAQAIGITKGTFRKHYREDITAGATRANANVIMKLYQDAVGEDRRVGVQAAKWWTQSRLGWSEKHEVSGPGGVPLPGPQSYVVRMPSPVESVKEWMNEYVPAEEREPS